MSPDQLLHHLGYDSMGNNEKLLLPVDKEIIDQGLYCRMSGETICDKCQYPLFMHPPVQGALWLNRICDGTLAKL